MRWTPGRISPDIEDRRGGGGGFGGMPIGIGGAVVLLILSLLFGKNFFALLDGGGTATQPGVQAPPASETPEEQQAVKFVSFVLDDAQNTWSQIMPEYRRARLVLFRDAVSSACGFAQAASGPFYCPLDDRVYIDLAFFDELKRRFGAPGDFAQAYVIAHEIGHHVQNVMGIAGRVQQAMEENPSAARELSVRRELQADCFAGIWGHSTANRKILEAGDVEEGLAAAAAVGDDNIQKMQGRAVNPESFNHGSSRERMTWFRRGLEGGRIQDCDTFR